MLTAEIIGERLKQAREEAGLSQEAVAEFLDVPRSAVSKIESGQQKIDSIQLRQLSGMYDVSLDELLAEPEEEMNEDKFVQALRKSGEKADVSSENLSQVEQFCEDYLWLHEQVNTNHGG